MKGYTQVGKIGTTHGADGEVNASIGEHYVESVLDVGWIFVEIDGQAIPFLLTHIRSGKGFILRFDEVDTREEAARLTGCGLLLKDEDVLVDEEFQPEKSGLQYAYLQGFELRDIEMGRIGIIREVREYPQQELALVEYDGRELLVPLHPALIEEENVAAGFILMRLPSGLIEL
jgi:16S rRNA processing protein RimM